MPTHFEAAYPETKAEAERLRARRQRRGRSRRSRCAPISSGGPGDNQLVPRLLERARAGRLCARRQRRQARRRDLHRQRRRGPSARGRSAGAGRRVRGSRLLHRPGRARARARADQRCARGGRSAPGDAQRPGPAGLARRRGGRARLSRSCGARTSHRSRASRPPSSRRLIGTTSAPRGAISAMHPSVSTAEGLRRLRVHLLEQGRATDERRRLGARMTDSASEWISCRAASTSSRERAASVARRSRRRWPRRRPATASGCC